MEGFLKFFIFWAVPFPSFSFPLTAYFFNREGHLQCGNKREGTRRNKAIKNTLIKSFSGGPGGRFFKKAPLSAGG